MEKGRLVIEIERNGDEMTENFKVSDMTLQEICVAVGSGINNYICDNTNDNAELFLVRIQAVRDIACFIGLEEISKSIDCALEKAEEQIANEKEK